MIVFRHIKTFSLVENYQLFRRPKCLHFLDANVRYQLQTFSRNVEPQCPYSLFGNSQRSDA